ncbi:glycoside hydrolase family 65 protein [uncultured Jatrophihabitans sp.]|uniref:glycoside hydrolase family 65 protein n=1 Tax=uncultured Jatrophihabitans sp. TaxID=1610747 RepID=UPI0035CBF11C
MTESSSGQQSEFPPDPWCIREVGLDQSALAQTESLFALSNGHIGVRGNLDEGDPSGLPGTYLNSFFETRPLPYAEAGYGYPESGQTVLNVTNGKLIRLLVDDEPMDLRYGTVLEHERVLDMRRGVLERRVLWQSPAGTKIRVRSERLVSIARRSIMAIRYRVEPVDEPVRVVVQSELVANETVPAQSKDPRVAQVLESPLEPVEHDADDHRAMLVHRTRASKLQMAAAMGHVVDASHGASTVQVDSHPDWARLTGSTALDVGEHLEITKFVAYGWSSQRSVPALRDQVSAALVSALDFGWDRIAEEQAERFDAFWQVADVQIDGPAQIQQAVRFGLFHTYQAGARAEHRAIPAKGLTGPGYDGHAFWDTETFVLPLLSATVPDSAADALWWRHATLDLARERANTLRLRGAAFPWRTIRGQECSAYWPAGTAAFHVNADIADAAARHVWWTGDEEFARECATDILVETARLWCSLGYPGEDGHFHIDGVTGPDEYSAMADDNVYTNLMAALNLRSAVKMVRQFPDRADELHVTDDELREWTWAADHMAVPYSDEHRVHEQSRRFTEHHVWDFENSAEADEYPLLLHAPYFDLYRSQVVKQADLLLAMHWAGGEFTPEQKAHAVAYYEPLTVRDSSLSACTQAVLAAEVGHLDLASDYLAEAALMDLTDTEHNSKDGLHIASLAGAWLAVVAGFGGMRDQGDRLMFRPQLPPGWKRLRFGVLFRGQQLHVDIGDGEVGYSVTGDEPVQLTHCNRNRRYEVTVHPGKTTKRKWSAVPPMTEPPHQPPGREPQKAPK